MNKDLIERVPVSESRLASGTWEGEVERGKGDIYASYSADVIGMENRVRAPFRYGSHLWACVSICGNGGSGFDFEAYRLLPETMFRDVVTNYNAKVRIDGSDAAPNDPNGFYHGMAVRHGGTRYVLAGPPCLFVVDPDATPAPQLQMKMF